MATTTNKSTFDTLVEQITTNLAGFIATLRYGNSGDNETIGNLINYVRFPYENGKKLDEAIAYSGIAEIQLEIVDGEGGHEGGGDYVERIVEIKHAGKHVAYVQFTGFYASYDGTTWDDEVTQVWPHQVTVTVYKPTKAD